MKQIFPQGAVPLLFAAVMAASFAAATPARAQSIGDGGGEGGRWKNEHYIEREAEALRKKKVAESQAGRDARQKAGIGIREFDARPIVSRPRRFVATGLDGPDRDNRGN